MAGNRRRKQGNSGVRTFLYVVVVLVLLGGMGYLFYYSRSQAKERQEYIRELESKEAATKGQVTAWTEEPESESETGKETEAEESEGTGVELEAEAESKTEVESESATEDPNQTQAEGDSDAEGSTDAKSETESESKSESGETTRHSGVVNVQRNTGNIETAEKTTDEESAEEQASFSSENPRIIILNGTGKSGVAAYWKRFLQAKGLTNIVMADYKGEVGDQTVVYMTEGGDAPVGVYSIFPNAEYRTGGLDSVDPNADTNVKIPDSQKKFDSYDVWIVVGQDDALHD